MEPARFGSRALTLVALCLLTFGCQSAAGTNFIIIQCDPSDSESCPPGDGFAQFCSLADNSICVNVCEGADALPSGCAEDSDCAAPDSCDNDEVSGSTCECVPACTDVGAAPQTVPEGGACFSDTDCVSGLMCDNTDAACACVPGKIAGCAPVDPPGGPLSGAPGAPCDEDGDCQANSCRDPEMNPSEGCTCRNVDGGGNCQACVGVNTGPVNAPDPATSCVPGLDEFSCDCMTQSGNTATGFLSSGGCIF